MNRRIFIWSWLLSMLLVGALIQRGITWSHYRNYPEIRQEVVRDEVPFFKAPDSLIAPNKRYFVVQVKIDTVRASGVWGFTSTETAIASIGYVAVSSELDCSEVQKQLNTYIETPAIKQRINNAIATIR